MNIFHFVSVPATSTASFGPDAGRPGNQHVSGPLQQQIEAAVDEGTRQQPPCSQRSDAWRKLTI